MSEESNAKPASASRLSLAIITEPGQANAFGTIHGGVLLKLADECGGVCALRHAGKGQITTATIDSMTFLGPVFVGERVEIVAEVTYVGRTSIETRIDIYAEPYDRAEKRQVAVGYALYVALEETSRRPRPVPSLLIETEADRRRLEKAHERQAIRLAPGLMPRPKMTMIPPMRKVARRTVDVENPEHSPDLSARASLPLVLRGGERVSEGRLRDFPSSRNRSRESNQGPFSTRPPNSTRRTRTGLLAQMSSPQLV